VNQLLERLQLANGDKLIATYAERDLLSRELQKLAGRKWCKSVENPLVIELLGEKFNWPQWRAYMASFPKAATGDE
jgi:hypothetical protein